VSRDHKKAQYPTLDELVERRRLAGGIDDEGARLLVTRNAQRGANGYHWRSDPRLRLPAALYLDEGQAQAILTSIQCPVHMILASDGLVVARPNTERRIEIMTNLVVEKMTGGHHLHMDNPGPVADVIVSFLQSHVPAGD
jgi:pimeloyl-ACP methyl ester carboxylesterase